MEEQSTGPVAREQQEQGAEHVAEGVIGMTAEELAAVAALALRAHPDAVPELVSGSSVAELVASLEPARAAYQRIAERVAAGGPPGGTPPVVPAGDAPRLAVDVEALPAAEKIRRGLATRK